MQSTEYIYGTNEVPEIPKEVIDARLVLLQEHLQKLLNIHYSKRDTARIARVFKAIKFWETINDN